MNEYQKLVVNFFSDDREMVEVKSNKFVKQIADLMTDSDFDGISALFNCAKSMKYSGQGYLEAIEKSDDEKYKIYGVGYVAALIDLLQLYQERLHVENEILKIRTKYRDSILGVLARRGTLFHKDLAAALGVSPSGLNAIIKQINETSIKLINVEEVSKFKIYSLTPVAYQYVMKYHLQNYVEHKKKRKKISINYTILEMDVKEEKKEEYAYCIREESMKNIWKTNPVLDVARLSDKKYEKISEFQRYELMNENCSVG